MAEPGHRAEVAREVAAAEAWFLAHGLPYFVDHIRRDVRARLGRARLTLVLGTALVVGVVAGVAAGLWFHQVAAGITTGTAVVLLVVTVYALRALQADTIAVWALRRAFASLGLLFPLATRALPMLLLFITFLFINTEVWQVSSALQGGVLWGSVVFFAAAASGFLLARLDEELDEFDDDVTGDTLIAATEQTPLAPTARRLVDEGVDLADRAEVTGLQKANLVLVLVVAQAVQVLLLSLAVFAFFLVFGSVAIEDSVVHTWVGGDAPTYLWNQHVVSTELAKVAVFLASFSALYFTVVAITDDLYRKQFFTAIMRELARVVGARVCYRELQGTPD